MSKIIIRVDISGIDEAKDRLDATDDRLKNLKPIFREIRDELSDAFRKNFLENGSLVGGWAPLDTGYGAWKSVHFPGAPPMVRSGKLFRSVSELRGRPNDIDNRSATFGTNVEYAKFHQYGTTKMPKREIIFEPLGFQDKWSKRMAEYIVNGTNDGRAES